MKERIIKSILLTLGYALTVIIMKALNLISFDIGMSIFFHLVGTFTYAVIFPKI